MSTRPHAPVHEQINQLTEEIKIGSEPFRRLVEEVSRVIVGQRALVHRMLIGLLGNGHLLIEGVPGLAKTTAVACLAKGIHTGFQRIQFTPDLLPADLIGTLVYRPQDQTFAVQKGPIFSNLILADEINRAPAKVQSASARGDARAASYDWPSHLSLGRAVLGDGDTESDRAGRDLSLARGSDGPLHDEGHCGVSQSR